ncbi:hypothetical protein [Kitasatospora sp. GP82]|uniref:hypothetical protein n=1 Tax=Kitasatospora sp. GP82 TaxID=3035089 RepID=UPI0024730232|nr:hypothetical protein [Kitasatospora sp. GP82]MDH6125697.1 hypothetical protein [Kitasatospora sp. GP82]
MNTPTKLATFALGLAATLGGAAGIGHAVGPIGSSGSTASSGMHHATATGSAAHGADSAAGHGSHDMTGSGTATEETPGGLMVSQHGYTLEPATRSLTAGEPQTLSFAVRGPDGKPVTDYSPTHEKDLHLIVVRRDLTSFQHLHPTRDAAGTWSIPLTLPTAGEYRMFTDFAPADGKGLTLGADLRAAGNFTPQPLPAPAASVETDGYTVTLDGTLEAGRTSKLTLTVSKDGKPVTDLQPYLAAYGHLVALRSGDLAYLHVHPDGSPGDGRTAPGPGITFYATVPSAGDYRLFLDFKHGDTVHTAAFTARAEAAPAGSATAGQGEATDHGDHGDHQH